MKHKIYIVTFNILNPQDHYAVCKLLLSMDSFRIFKETDSWLIAQEKEEDAEHLYSLISRFTTKEDLVFISEITDNRQGWLPKDVWNWLKKRT